MEKYKDIEVGGERPFYHIDGLDLENVTIHTGESSVKECRDVECRKCTFDGKYVLWCCDNFKVRDSLFLPGSRSSLWHSTGADLENCQVDAPKMFRESEGIRLHKDVFSDAKETLWSCGNIEIDDVEFHNADYIFMWCHDVKARNLRIFGNYSFQHAKNVEIWDSDLQSKDALWEAENVTVYNSFINGEYLAWHSKNVRLVNCRIGGTQPLCYAEGLVLENCTFEPDADLAFEYSDVQATVVNEIPSVKNPRTGCIKAASYGEIIIDGNMKAPGDCKIL
ncbi:MAG: DUF3737 family protein [Bacteroidales bacterium]|nr:DUF3737 family protein [Bacteroidales bacterium]